MSPEPVFGFEEMGGVLLLVIKNENSENEILFYSPREDKWINTSEMVPLNLPVNSSSVSIQGFLYLVGGVFENGEISNNLSKFQGVFVTAFPNVSK